MRAYKTDGKKHNFLDTYDRKGQMKDELKK